GFLLFILLAAGRSASDPGAGPDAHGHGPSAALAVSISETPEAVLLHIQAAPEVEPGAVEGRLSRRQAGGRGGGGAGGADRSRPLALPEPVVEEGASADYDADGVFVLTLPKQAIARGARPTGAVEAVAPWWLNARKRGSLAADTCLSASNRPAALRRGGPRPHPRLCRGVFPSGGACFSFVFHGGCRV